MMEVVYSLALPANAYLLLQISVHQVSYRFECFNGYHLEDDTLSI